VGPRDWPAAVLIRGVMGCAGPGRVTRTLGLDRRLNGTTADSGGGLWIEDHGIKVPRGLVRATPRIGVAYAGPVWAKKPWRFTFDPTALRARPAGRRRAKSTPAPRRA